MKAGHSFAPRTQCGAVLGTWWYRYPDVFSVQAGYGYFCSEGCIGKGDGAGTIKIVPVSFQMRVRLNQNPDQQISGRAALRVRLSLAGKSQEHTVPYAGRNLDLDLVW